jgi:acyl-CoA thioesterase I
MRSAAFASLLLSVYFGVGSAWAEQVRGSRVPIIPSPEPPLQETLDTSLSLECRVPGSKLYTLAPLSTVRAALDEKRPIKVLALGPSGTAGLGSGSASATYPARLEGELEKLLPGVDVLIEHRSLPGEITADVVERLRAVVTEIKPDLVVWQVGINDALAKADVEAFTGALNEILEWLSQHDIDAVLVEPPYNSTLASDEHYNALRAAIQNSARQNGAPFVLRFKALQFLSQQKSEATKNQFRLSELGYRCMAEHIARTIILSILEPSPPDTEAPK